MLSLASRASDTPVLFYEEFSGINNWQPFFIFKNKKYSIYSLKDGERFVLKGEHSVLASAIMYKLLLTSMTTPKSTGVGKWSMYVQRRDRK